METAMQVLLLDDPDSEAGVDQANAIYSHDEDVGESSNLWWGYLLLDPARIIIFIASLVLITHASQRAVILDKDSKEDSTLEGVQNLTWYHVVCLPLLGSVMLLVFFYFFEFIQFFYTILCTFVSILAMYNLFYPPVERLLNRCNLSSVGKPSPVLMRIVTAILSVTMASLWVLTGHWICLDMLGAALCVLMIQFVRVPSLKISILLLGGLLVYDVFWVFCSSSFFDANVMVEVAVKKAQNPVAMIAHKLDLPEIAKSRPSLSIPGKLLVPCIGDGKAFAMLGLGDIVLPGLLLCFAMRFDTLCQSNGSTLSNGVQRCTNCVLHCRKWSYFSISLAGYAIGLLIASLVADLSGAAQPALLYLVPCVVLPLLGKATIQGDFKVMWSGPFSPPSTVQTKGYQKISQYAILPT